MISRRECERTEDIGYFRRPRPDHPNSESSKVPQTDAPSVDVGKLVDKALQPRHPFPWGWIPS